MTMSRGLRQVLTLLSVVLFFVAGGCLFGWWLDDNPTANATGLALWGVGAWVASKWP